MALADSTIENKALERLIEQVNEFYKTDVKKNLGPEPSKPATKKTNSR
jgi:hypothetical protein